MLNWLPTLLAAKGVAKPDAAIVQLAFNLGGALGALGVAWLFYGSRRAATLGVWFAGTAVGVALLALSPPTLLLSALAGLAAGTFISSTPTALYALSSDFYAVEMRATGLGGVIGVGRIGAVLGPLLAGALLAHGKDYDRRPDGAAAVRGDRRAGDLPGAAAPAGAHCLTSATDRSLKEARHVRRRLRDHHLRHPAAERGADHAEPRAA